jgi:hypothetical protein
MHRYVSQLGHKPSIVVGVFTISVPAQQFGIPRSVGFNHKSRSGDASSSPISDEQRMGARLQKFVAG